MGQATLKADDVLRGVDFIANNDNDKDVTTFRLVETPEITEALDVLAEKAQAKSKFVRDAHRGIRDGQKQDPTTKAIKRHLRKVEKAHAQALKEAGKKHDKDYSRRADYISRSSEQDWRIFQAKRTMHQAKSALNLAKAALLTPVPVKTETLSETRKRLMGESSALSLQFANSEKYHDRLHQRASDLRDEGIIEDTSETRAAFERGKLYQNNREMQVMSAGVEAQAALQQIEAIFKSIAEQQKPEVTAFNLGEKAVELTVGDNSNVLRFPPRPRVEDVMREEFVRSQLGAADENIEQETALDAVHSHHANHKSNHRNSQSERGERLLAAFEGLSAARTGNGGPSSDGKTSIAWSEPNVDTTRFAAGTSFDPALLR